MHHHTFDADHEARAKYVNLHLGLSLGLFCLPLFEYRSTFRVSSQEPVAARQSRAVPLLIKTLLSPTLVEITYPSLFRI